MQLQLVAYGVAAIMRIVLPYVLEWVNNRELRFDWRYLVGQVLGALIALVPTLFTDEFVLHLQELTWVVAAGLGWAAADLGRTVQKYVVRRS